MYKFKIIHYHPYEHTLFQETLNQLGQAGYDCKDLSLLAFFKKTEHPITYYITFFHNPETKRLKKNAQSRAFCQDYINKGYVPIYEKRHMYVFKHVHDSSLPNDDDIDSMTLYQSGRLKAIMSALMWSALMLFSLWYTISQSTIDTWLSYGIIIACLGLFVAFVNRIFQAITSFIAYNSLLKEKPRPLSWLKKRRLVAFSLISLASLMIIGGLVEDMTNAKIYTSHTHPILTLEALEIQEENTLTTQQQSSFVVPHYYKALSISKSGKILLTKEYQFPSSKQSQNLFLNYIQEPERLLCTRIDRDQNILYGYHDNTLTTIVIMEENRVIVISFNFELSTTQQKSILEFYQK